MSTDDTRNYILKKFSTAIQDGTKKITLVSGDIHSELKYNTNQHQSVCSAMYSMPKYYDCEIICTKGPPSGFGARVEVTYLLKSDTRLIKAAGKMRASTNGKHDDSFGLEKLKGIIEGKKVLFVLPCCDSKESGGQSLSSPSSGTLDLLLNEVRQSILDGRKHVLADEKSKSIVANGYEFGNTSSTSALYRPAYDRYRGFLYRTLGVKAILEKPEPNKVCIMSALYGVIMCDDQIQDYDLVMNGRVEREWRIKIPTILDNLAAKTRAQVIVGLFGQKTGYAKCFTKLSHHPNGCPVYHVYSYNTGRTAVLTDLGKALVYLASRSTEAPAECRVRIIRS